MDDECIQLKDVPIYRPSNLVRQVTVQQETFSPTREQPASVVPTQNLFEQLIDQLTILIKDSNEQQIANIMYQIFLNIGWSMFNRSTQAQILDKCRIAKHQCIYFYQRLRKYFELNGTEKMNNLLVKLQRMQTDQDEEITKSPLIRKTMRSSYQVITHQSLEPNEEQSKEIEMKDQQLKELQSRLEYKDNAIKDITQGYLKDVQHMKELLFRKGDKQETMFEVQYFDCKEGINEEQMNLLNQKIRDIQSQFQVKYQEMSQTIQNLTAENKQFISQIDKYKEKLKVHDTSIGLLARVIQMDNNDPYVTWRSIQDLKGNSYFFQVFENQKHTYGINYREIDKLLLQSKASQREITHYRQQLEDQMSQFVNRQIDYIKDLQIEIEEKNDQIDELKNNNQFIVNECLQQSRIQMEAALQHRKTESIQYIIIVLQQLFQQFNELNEIKTNFDHYKAKEMFNKWILINRMLRCVKTTRDQQVLRQEIKEILMGKKEIEDKILELKQKWKKKKLLMKTQYDELKEQFEHEKYNQIYWEYKFLGQQKAEQILNTDIQFLQQQVSQQQETIKQQTLKYQVMCQHYAQLYRLFDSKILNFDAIDQKQIKMVEYKLKQSDQNKECVAQQMAIQQNFQQLRQETILQAVAQRSKFTQTTIMNVSIPLQNTNLNHQLIEKVIKLKLVFNETSTKGTNTDETIFDDRKQIVTVNIEIQCQMGVPGEQQILQFCSLCKQKSQSEQLRMVKTPSQLCLLEEISEQMDVQKQGSMKIKQVDTEIVNQQIEDNFVLVKRQSIKFTKNDFQKREQESHLLHDQNRLFLATPQTPQQVSLRVKDQIEQLTYLSSNKQNNIDFQQDIFQRLYKDSLNRKQRLQILKNNIETLDQFKWEQILQIIQSNPIDQSRGLSQKPSKRSQLFSQKQQRKAREIDLRLSDQERDQFQMSKQRKSTSNNRTFHVSRPQSIKKQNTTFDFQCNKSFIQKF